MGKRACECGWCGQPTVGSRHPFLTPLLCVMVCCKPSSSSLKTARQGPRQKLTLLCHFQVCYGMYVCDVNFSLQSTQPVIYRQRPDHNKQVMFNLQEYISININCKCSYIINLKVQLKTVLALIHCTRPKL